MNWIELNIYGKYQSCFHDLPGIVCLCKIFPLFRCLLSIVNILHQQLYILYTGMTIYYEFIVSHKFNTCSASMHKSFFYNIGHIGQSFPNQRQTFLHNIKSIVFKVQWTPMTIHHIILNKSDNLQVLAFSCTLLWL